MWPNYPETEQVGTAFKLRQRMKNLPSCAHVLRKALNLSFYVVVWPSTAKKRTKIYNARAEPLFFSLNPTVLWRSRCRLRIVAS